MRKTITIIFLVLIFIAQCYSPKKIDAKSAKDIILNITYIKDTKKNICFGMINLTGVYDGFSLIEIDCEKIGDDYIKMY